MVIFPNKEQGCPLCTQTHPLVGQIVEHLFFLEGRFSKGWSWGSLQRCFRSSFSFCRAAEMLFASEQRSVAASLLFTDSLSDTCSEGLGLQIMLRPAEEAWACKKACRNFGLRRKKAWACKEIRPGPVEKGWVCREGFGLQREKV